MWRYPEPDPDNPRPSNVWGWKFSLFGAFLIGGLLLLALVVAHRRGVSLLDAGREVPAIIAPE